jgi:methylenetetrahydrofolate dehydrogenase (NADP+)/methenyltetrahydrofolate cyclohydrolase
LLYLYYEIGAATIHYVPITSKIIDGKAVAHSIKTKLAGKIAEASLSGGRAPGLAVIIVGDDPASHYYVRSKQKSCADVGISSYKSDLPATTTKEQLIRVLQNYNDDTKVDGILLQLPLPAALAADTQEIIDSIHPDKDVDGLTTINLGRLITGSSKLIYPCTPKGCMELLRDAGVELAGKRALVIGRSNLVGKPIAIMLNQAHATVTMAHSRSADLAQLVSEADILVAAIGKPEFIQGSWLKPGAVVIDVGINAVYKKPDERSLVGDVEFETAGARASAITPVPGGVGPMTVAMLLENCYELYLRH